MSIDILNKTETLYLYIGEIDDKLIADAEAVKFSQKAKRKRMITYGAIATGASGVAAAAFLLLRNSRKKTQAA